MLKVKAEASFEDMEALAFFLNRVKKCNTL